MTLARLGETQESEKQLQLAKELEHQQLQKRQMGLRLLNPEEPAADQADRK
jgi:hypothetical protein